MTAPTPPAVSDAMREAVAPVTRAEVRACIGPTIPLRRRWVDLLMQGPIARLQAQIARLTGERDAKLAEAAKLLFDAKIANDWQVAFIRNLTARAEAAEAETARLRAALEDTRAAADELAPLCIAEGDTKGAGALQYVSGFISDRLAALTSQEKTDV